MSLFDAPAFSERLFFPRADPSPAPAGAVDFEVVSGEARLHVRWHPRQDGVPTLLLFHGNGEIVADYDDAAGRFADAGVNLAVVDYRGYGKSTGVPTLRDALADAPRVLEAVRDRVAAPVFVMGRSLGSACAAELYAGTPDGVLGFVLESGFVDLHALIRRRGIIPPAELPADDRAVFDPLPKLARGELPLLVLHGAADEMIAPSEAQRAHDAAGARDKQLVYVPRRGHNDVAGAALYWDALAGFVTRARAARAG